MCPNEKLPAVDDLHNLAFAVLGLEIEGFAAILGAETENTDDNNAQAEDVDDDSIEAEHGGDGSDEDDAPIDDAFIDDAFIDDAYIDDEYEHEYSDKV